MTETDDNPGQRRFVCTDCEAAWFSERRRCPECGSSAWTDRPLGVGVIVASTVARVTPAAVRDENPLGLARFEDDVTVIAQLPVDPAERPAVGDPVRLTGEHRLRDGDEPVDGPRFHPA